MEIVSRLTAVLSLAHEYKNKELYQQLVDMMAQVRALDEEKSRLEQEVRTLQEQLKVKEDTVFRDGALWPKKKGGSPYCSRCFEVETKLIHLHPNLMSGERALICPNCRVRVYPDGAPKSPWWSDRHRDTRRRKGM